LLCLRRAEPALSIGSFHMTEGGDHVLAYERRHGDTCLHVALNVSSTERQIEPLHGGLLLSTLGNPPSGGWLRPDEGIIMKLED
jgi:alpha-glucosidase